MPRMILTLSQNTQFFFFSKVNILKNILTLSPNAKVKTCFDFCFNYVAYNLTVAENKLIFKNLFPSYDSG